MSSIRPVAVNNTELLFVAASSKLNQPVFKGDTTVDVYSIEGFSVDSPMLIGNFGNEGSEIINIHDTTAPLNNTITLASALTKDHQQDADVHYLLFDQVELSHSDTIDGTKAVLETTTINPEEADFILTDSTRTGGYYFIRYKNSIDSSFSDYSDPIPHEGFPDNTVSAVIQEVLDDMGESLGKTLTQTMMIKALNRMLREVRGRLNKWSNYQKFDYILGQLSYGQNKFDLPDDIYTSDTNRCVKAVRISSELPLYYIDKNQYDAEMEQNKHTQVATEALAGDTTLALDSTADLDASGTISVFVNNVKCTVSYTGKTDSTNELTGIPATGDGSITVTIPVDSDVWDDEIYSQPRTYTIFDGQIHIPHVATNDFIGKNIHIDYWTDVNTVDSDADVLNMPRYDMAYYYLKAYVRAQLENNAEIKDNDPDIIQFERKLAAAIRREHTGQRRRRAPRMNGISYSNSLNQN